MRLCRRATIVGLLLLVGVGQTATRPTAPPIEIAEAGTLEIVELTPGARRVAVDGEQAAWLRAVLRERPIEARGRDPHTESDDKLNRHGWAELLIDGHRVRIHGVRWTYVGPRKVYAWASPRTYALTDILIADRGMALEGDALRDFIQTEIGRVSKWLATAQDGNEPAASQPAPFAPTGAIELRVTAGPSFMLEGDAATALRQELNAPHMTRVVAEGEGKPYKPIPQLIMVVDGHELQQHGIGWNGIMNGTAHKWVTPVTYALHEAVEGERAPVGVLRDRVRTLVLEAAALKNASPPPPAP